MFLLERRHKFTTTLDGGGTVTWDTTLAVELANVDAHVRAVVDIDVVEMRGIMERNDWSEAKIATVDCSIPGVGAPIEVNGEKFYILIDGTHRCVRALRDGLIFRARLLTVMAAARCVLSDPNGLTPTSELAEMLRK